MHDPTLGPRPLAVYIATTLSNWEAHNRVAAEFRADGWEVTYDWTVHGSVADMGLSPSDREAAAREIGIKEIDGILDADLVVVLLPGGPGTHTELGAALARGIPVILFAPDLPADGRYPSFYRHPLVIRVEEEAQILPSTSHAMILASTQPSAFTFRAYAQFRKTTAVYPDHVPGVPVYPALGLCGEAGEVAEKIKKWLRDDNGDALTDAQFRAMRKELGDVLWYLDALCHDLGTDLDTVARENVEKLQDRALRGTLQGSGDAR